MGNFAHPALLWLFTLFLPMIAWYVYRSFRGGATMLISSADSLSGANRTFRYYLRHVPFALRCIAIALIIIALARPQTSESGSTVKTKGIDIMMALDISGSMLARDFTPDRLEAAKEVAANFINDRRGDRIGLVVFAGESFTQSPLTTDKATLLNLLSRVRTGMIEDGTAIGNGLATAVNRLRESDARSKVIILLTDGVNNRGQIAPLTAAEIAQTLDIKVYTIGVGSRGTAPTPAYDMWGNMTYVNAPVEIDEQMLTDIASLTGGQYFRATDKHTLQNVYDTINQLEKSEIETNDFTLYHELYGAFVLAALLLLLAEQLLRLVVLRRIP